MSFLSRQDYLSALAKMSENFLEIKLFSLRKFNPTIKHYRLDLTASMPLFKKGDSLMSVKVRWGKSEACFKDFVLEQSYTLILPNAPTNPQSYELLFNQHYPFALSSPLPIEVYLVVWFRNGRKKEYNSISPVVSKLIVAEV